MKRVKRKRERRTRKSKLWQERSWRLARCAGCWLGPREINSTYCSNVRVHLLRANGGLNSNARARHPCTMRILIPQAIITRQLVSCGMARPRSSWPAVTDIKFFSRAWPLSPLTAVLLGRHRATMRMRTSLPYLSDTRRR